MNGSLYRNGISALFRRGKSRRSTSIWTDLPMSSTPLSMLMRSDDLRGPRRFCPQPATSGQMRHSIICRRPGSASRWRRIGHFHSCILICFGNGAELARKSFRSHHWPMRLPTTPPTRSGCREAIRNSMPALWRRRIVFAQVFAHWPNVPFPSTVSAGAIWCWDAGSRMPTGAGTR